MNKALKIFLIVLSLIIVSFSLFFVFSKVRPKKAGISIDTIPSSLVFINGAQVGKTPYKGTFDAGEVELKLVPEASDKPLLVFETRLLLSSGIETVVKREFGESLDLTAGEIVSFEKTQEESPSFAVVTDPASAEISIDGKSYGFSPYKTSQISVSNHQLTANLEGYLSRTIDVRTISGYKLTLIIKLARDLGWVSPTPVPTVTPKPEVKVEILSTPNGFLRVREEASTDSLELARVTMGETYVLVEEDISGDWYKIQYLKDDKTKTGWISSEFAKKLN